jgi:uncharacterized protein (DUF488 family)
MNKADSKPTYWRQRFLLAFIRQLNGSVTATDLQKLVFLNIMASGSDAYEFVPYKYGSYSFQLAEDLNILHRDGYLSFSQTEKSTRIKAAGSYSQEASFEIADERGDALIRKTYREYPYYALNSEIIGRIFSDRELEQYNSARKARIKTEQVLYTIGYEGKSVEAFINALIKNDIRVLCDVRKNPLSRKFGFSKGKLSHITQAVGVEYVHVPELGIESNKRRSLETVEDYQSLFSDYAKTLSDRKPWLEQVYTLLCLNSHIALMCYEREPEMCHRHVVRDYLTDTHTIRSVDL